MMNEDKERSERVKNVLRDNNLDAVVCALPSNVLMLTGYFPVVGTSVAIFTREGEICLLAPEDEMDLAEQSRADKVRTFKPGSLEELRNAFQAVQKPFVEALNFLCLSGKRIGYERGAYFQPASYVAMHFYGAGLIDLLETEEASILSRGVVNFNRGDDRFINLYLKLTFNNDRTKQEIRKRTRNFCRIQRRRRYAALGIRRFAFRL